MAAAATTLSAAISSSGATSCTVRDVIGFADASDTDDLVLVDSEYLLVTAGLGTTSWTITRGYAGSTAATHLNGATVTRLARGYTDTTAVRKLLDGADITSATANAFLVDGTEAANAWLTGEVGMFIGPSTDTSRTFDVDCGSRSLRVRGGIRSVTSMTVKRYTGATAETANAADYVLRPLPQDLRLGFAPDRIEFIDRGWTGSIYQFFPGVNVATVTSTQFGPAEPPTALSRIAATVGVWMYKSLGQGQGGAIGSDQMGETILSRVLTPTDNWTIQRFRNAIRSFGWI